MSNVNRREFCRGVLLGASGWSLALADAAGSDAATRPSKKQPSAHGILRLRLETHRLAEVRAFYRDKFRFPIREESADSVTFQAGTTALTFVRTAAEGSRPFYHFAFNIPENKLPSAREWLMERTPLATNGKQDVYNFPHWNAHSIYYWDPAGNLGELIARHDLPNARSGPFVAEEILYASEIGLVVKDVPAAVRTLQSRLDVPVYRGSSDTFAPLGDAHRLLIVAQEGRPWLNRPAGIYPASASLQGRKAGQCDLAGHPYAVEVRPG